MSSPLRLEYLGVGLEELRPGLGDLRRGLLLGEVLTDVSPTFGFSENDVWTTLGHGAAFRLGRGVPLLQLDVGFFVVFYYCSTLFDLPQALRTAA